MNNIKKVFLVGAGKGGVGKSMTAVNLAVALQKISGKEVGLLDADIYGPSIPTILGLQEHRAPPFLSSSGFIEAPLKEGIRSMSISYLSDASATVWRGPMLMKALQTMLTRVDWGSSAEFLVVDLPPGTGDAPLSIHRSIGPKIAGAILCSTTNYLSISDVCRAAAMFDMLRIPVVGMVENMSFYRCSSCSNENQLHSSLEPSQMSKANQLSLKKIGPTLLRLPFDPRVGTLLESGNLLLTDDNPFRKDFLSLAEKIIFPLKNETTKSFKEQ